MNEDEEEFLRGNELCDFWDFFFYFFRHFYGLKKWINYKNVLISVADAILTIAIKRQTSILSTNTQGFTKYISKKIQIIKVTRQ